MDNLIEKHEGVISEPTDKEVIWGNIPGTKEGDYQVSTSGLVRSCRFNKIKILATVTNQFGYKRVEIVRNGATKLCLVHRLVAETFIPNPDPVHKNTVNHLNEDKSDNNVDNLCWMSQQANCNYGTRNARIADSRKWYKHHSLATRHQMSTSHCKVIIRCDKINCIKYSSVSEAVKALIKEGLVDKSLSFNTLYQTVAAAARGAKSSAYGFIWFYEQDLDLSEYTINE